MKTFLKSKIGTALLAVGLVVFVFVTVKTLTQKYQLDKQVRQLQARAEQIKGQNEKLSDLVNYLNTDQYKEKAAREQLNLKKEGEFVVGLPNQQEQVAGTSTTVEQSNPQKWYSYFFKPNGTK